MFTLAIAIASAGRRRIAGWVRMVDRIGIFISAMGDVSIRLLTSRVRESIMEVMNVGTMRMQYMVLIPPNADRVTHARRNPMYVLICSIGKSLIRKYKEP